MLRASEEQPHRCGGTHGREEIDPEGNGAHRQLCEQPGQQGVGWVSSGMGNPKRPGGSDQVATIGAIVGERETRCQSGHIDQQCHGRCAQGRPPAVAVSVKGIRGDGRT